MASGRTELKRLQRKKRSKAKQKKKSQFSFKNTSILPIVFSLVVLWYMALQLRNLLFSISAY